MPFTAQELDNIANSALDFYIKGKPLSQTIQDKPLLKAMMAKKKTFPGGKGEISLAVKNEYSSSFAGYEHDDTVSYVNPANIKRAAYAWKELHSGIQLTHSELKKDGISVVDTNGEETANHSDREITALTNILEDKFEDLDEGTARSMNSIMWGDGTSSSKIFGGILYFLSGTPTTGVVGGIDRALNSYWRNRSSLGIVQSAANQTLTKTLRSEWRQLRRYGGSPDLILCGSTFLEALDLEVAEKGTYTQQGFTKNGSTDIGMAEVSMRGAGTFQYDPTLDDLGYAKYCFMIDPRHIYPMVMEGEDMKKHSPARPAEKYVLYRGVTWTGCMVANKLNAHGVYSIA